ncbi:MAG: GTP-binding protein [Candidatus Lokiarchaeota archaeon]|nr:GTP-binding protein [Candidatus Lokiarchaeota archaeon]
MMKPVLKILILGDGGVGKTTLLHRFVKGKFIDTMTMTIGVEVLTKEIEIDSKPCQLMIWDVTGQERFRFMIEDYFRGAHGALILFDITNMKSFVNIEKWMTLIKKVYNNFPVILVASKYDLEEFSMVGDLYATKLQKRLGMIDYVKTSSKLGLNIDTPFELVSKHAINSETAIFKEK